MPANAVARRAAGWKKGILMNKSALALCAAMSLGVTGCSHDPAARGALRGGGIGAAAGALASLVIPGFPLWGGVAMGAIGGAGIGAATSKKSYHHTEGERRQVDQSAAPADQPAPEAAPEAPPGG
jgi:hypothetical protein